MPIDLLADWFYQHVAPLLEAYFASDMDAARASYGAAVASLGGEPDTDLREAKRLRLEAAWVYVLVEIGDRAEAWEAYHPLLASFAAPQPGPQSARLAHVSELLTRLHLDLRGLEPLPGHLLAELMARVPDENRGPNYWHQVGCWAFMHGDRELLDEAYGYFTTERTAQMADWLYARLRLMRNLLARTASSAELLQTVKLTEMRQQLTDLQRLVLPTCEAQGLVTREVLTALDRKRAALEAAATAASQ